MSTEPGRGSTRRRVDQPIGVAVLGSTGSIGRQALEVLAALPGRFRVVALAARRDVTTLAEQARRLRPAVVGWTGEGDGVREPDLPSGTALVRGGNSLLAELVTRSDVHMVVVATGGTVSLAPAIAALQAGKIVATANKEALVAAGHLVMPLAAALAAGVRSGDPNAALASPLAWLRPIDSEHSAIWQCLAGEDPASVRRLFLTASGGPFRDLPAAGFASITPEQALRHPTWTMGRKITIDSATLVNKGLEVIEAHWLYDVPYDAIEVLIHPQSVVHSAVQFVDGSLKAQLGTPDMRLPIQYALTYPDRIASPAEAADLVRTGHLEFFAPDEGRFPALRIAREAGPLGARATTALIAADEVAVERFLDGTLDFAGIPRVLEAAVARFGQPRSGERNGPVLQEVIALDLEVRAVARQPGFGAVR